MTSPDHLSGDRISDLLAGVLPPSEAMTANAHVAGCAACQERRDDLLAVTSRLREQAAEPIPMPADVAAALTAALDRASAERAAGVRTLEPVRRPPARQPLRWLAGAAAAVVVAGIGVAGLRAIDSGDGSSSAGGSPGAGVAQSGHGESAYRDEAGGSPDAAGESAPTNSFASPSKTGGVNIPVLPSLSSPEIAVQARRLATGGGAPVAPQAVGCARPITGRPVTAIRFEGSRAVLSIVRTTRLVTVYDCATGTEPLFVSGY